MSSGWRQQGFDLQWFVTTVVSRVCMKSMKSEWKAQSEKWGTAKHDDAATLSRDFAPNYFLRLKTENKIIGPISVASISSFAQFCVTSWRTCDVSCLSNEHVTNSDTISWFEGVDRHCWRHVTNFKQTDGETRRSVDASLTWWRQRRSVVRLIRNQWKRYLLMTN